jgi:predicted MPP superfamily phosphohydrolase
MSNYWIIHFSDTHAQGQVMQKLEEIMRRKKYRNYHVVAFTGDGSSKSEPIVSERWNKWPQTFKLAVPGNHNIGNVDPLRILRNGY